MAVSLVWFRHDLRLADNPALSAACARGAVVPVFVWDPEEGKNWRPGAASKWWLHQSLHSLSTDLKELGSRLIVRRGNALEQLTSLLSESGATAIFWNRRYKPAAIAQEKLIEQHFRATGIAVNNYNSHLLLEPWEVKNKSGKPFQVFTPFWKTCLQLIDWNKEPLPCPTYLQAPARWPKTTPLTELELEPKINWAAGIAKAWQPGESGAHQNCATFVREHLVDYTENRNRPDLLGTSRLSPHLHFGEISPQQIISTIDEAARKKRTSQPVWKQSQFVTELGWREFAHHLLFHFPQTPDEPLRPEFAQFPWHTDNEALKAWQRGRTGYPIVDAGMRELWHTGWMHNRVRMIVASFLIKDLLLPWKSGAQWFWDTLVDADLANNSLGWQWSAGCGADAAPFFRIFNPVTQGEKFDPKGHYVRKWIPEIAGIPDRWLHAPWTAPKPTLVAANVELGTTYPKPIVNHSIAREVALEAFQTVKRSR